MNIMEYQGFKARIMKAAKLSSDRSHGLPPGQPIDIYPVDIFKNPLPSWIRGKGNYVVPVKSDWGLWFDWTQNDHVNTCVLPTVKGMNPITGKKTEGFSLEQYKNKCPTHDIDFLEDRFCTKCNFKWAPQNYVSYPNKLWWDGFRASDGKVRQFFFTEDLQKSVPEQIMGEKETIPACGFAFFKPINPVTKPINHPHQNFNYPHQNLFDSYSSTSNSTLSEYINKMNISEYMNKMNIKEPDIEEGSSYKISDICDNGSFTESLSGRKIAKWNKELKSDGVGIRGCGISPTACSYTASLNASVASAQCVDPGGVSIFEMERPIHTQTTVEVGVGAGAEIVQTLMPDYRGVSTFWLEAPSAVMRIYFVFMDQFEKIKADGMFDLNGQKEGFLAGLNIG